MDTTDTALLADFDFTFASESFEDIDFESLPEADTSDEFDGFDLNDDPRIDDAMHDRQYGADLYPVPECSAW